MAKGDGDGKRAAAELARKGGKPFHRPTFAVRGRLRNLAAGKGFAEPNVLLRWDEAVGADLSGICQPVKVIYGAALGATLVVRVSGARAVEVEHKAPRILERINAFYGYKAVARLRITQATGARGELPAQAPILPRGFAEPGAAFQGKTLEPVAPKPDAEVRAARLTADIENPDLRAALTKMGAWVLSKPPATSEKDPSR